MKNSAVSCLCFLYLIVLATSGGDVTGSVNGILHVPCTYSVDGGQQHVCWGRGECPWYGCNDEMIKTDGHNVTWRKSDRYQLLGDITEGDVSLTITGATEEDGGTYCCKVKVNGLFNDVRTEINVNMNEENPVSTSETSNSQTYIPTTRQSMYDTHDVPHNPVTHPAWTTSQETRPSEQSQSTSATINVIRGVVVTLFLITLMGIFIYIYKYRNWKKTWRSAMEILLSAFCKNKRPVLYFAKFRSKVPLESILAEFCEQCHNSEISLSRLC